MFRKLLAALAVAFLLAGCWGDGDDAASSAPPSPVVPVAPTPYKELVVVSDQLTIASVSTAGTASTVLSTMTIAGLPGTYARAGSTVTVTLPNHGIRDGLRVGLDFAAGTGGTATSGSYIAHVVDANTFTVTDTASGSITGGAMTKKIINSFSGTYTQTSTTLTIMSPAHSLQGGDTVDLKIVTGGGVAGNYEVDSVIDGDTFSVVTSTAGSGTGSLNITLGTNYITTDIVMHPNGKWIYASSTYDCYNGDPYCWGGDLITQYSIDWLTGKLTPVASVRTSTDTSEASPVKMTINPAGTQLVHQDDDLDGLRLWTIDPATGALTQVANSGSNTTNQHGIAFSADGAYVYHGGSVFSVTATAITKVTSGAASAATQLVNGKIYSIQAGNDLTVFSFTTPTTLTRTAFIDTGVTNEARDIAVSKDGSLILASGFGGIKSFSFSGTTLTAAVSAAGPTQVIDGGGSAWPGSSAASTRVYRGISLNDAGNLAVSSYFTANVPNAGQGGLPASGYVLLSVGANGALTLLTDQSVAQYARVSKFFKNPN